MALARTYIQKMAGENNPVLELLEDFQLYTGAVPFREEEKVKDLPKNDWKDEDGDDEFVPEELKVQAYEMQFEIGYKGEFGTAEAVIEEFKDAMRKMGEFKMYCSYNKMGRTHIRYVGVGKPTVAISDEGEGDIFKWPLKLKVNDPVTGWRYSPPA